MNANSTKGKKRKPIDNHITLVTDPTKLVQPYKTTSSAHTSPNADNCQHKKFKTNDAALHSNASLQSSIPLKPASLPGLIVVNKSSAVVSQQTSLLTNSGINIDMSLTQISDPNFRHIISQCIKVQVFRRCKFYNKEHHGTYNEKPTTFCGMVLKYCNIIANEAWWYNTRKMIVITHTNHRNNCIKAVKLKFKEGCPKPTTTQPFVTPNMSLFSGCQMEIENLLTMRANVCHYCAILDMYAPCIVSYRTWNRDANMKHYCCTTDPKLFNANVLSVSDEAFLLLVLINGGARWMSEIKREHGKNNRTWTEDQELAMPLPLYTYSRLRGKQTNGGGSGWSIEGRKKYDELFMAVKADRKQNAKQFNPQLLLFFQARRRRDQLAKHNAKDDARPKAKVAYHCMNELEDDDLDEEDNAHEHPGLSDNENDSDSENYNDHRPMNVFAL